MNIWNMKWCMYLPRLRMEVKLCMRINTTVTGLTLVFQEIIPWFSQVVSVKSHQSSLNFPLYPCNPHIEFFDLYREIQGLGETSFTIGHSSFGFINHRDLLHKDCTEWYIYKGKYLRRVIEHGESHCFEIQQYMS